MGDPIAYTYEADHHCPACTIARFGTTEHGIGAGRWPLEDARDAEGNPIGAVAPWDEWYEPSEIAVQVLICSDCGRELDRYEPYDLILADAERRGIEDGTAAGSWVVDGNTPDEAKRHLIRGIEDGDPMILDQLPSSPLSGEWADGLLPRDVLEWYGITEDVTCANDILTAYEDGYMCGVMDEVQRSAWYAADCPPIERTS